ncbi:MAG: hypothetical protein WD004_02560 [Actinomycetota bacterium]
MRRGTLITLIVLLAAIAIVALVQLSLGSSGGPTCPGPTSNPTALPAPGTTLECE